MMVFSLANVAYRAGCGKCGAWYQRDSLCATNALAFFEPGALASAVLAGVGKTATPRLPSA